MKKFYILLIILFILFAGCEKFFVEAPSNDPEAIFENLWSTFNEEYAPFEERGVDWDAVYQQYRPLVTSSTSDEALFNILAEMLQTLDDGHVSLTAPNREVFFSNRIRREKTDDGLFSMEVVKNYLEEDYREDDEGSYVWGKIQQHNVAYIYFDHVAFNMFQLNDFLDAYPDAEGYIIDLRHNQGGDFTFTFSVMGRLTSQDRMVFRSKTKNGFGKGDYTSWTEWSIHTEGETVQQPLIVLTDRYTISAGERTVMAFMTLPNATIMGDTTNGAHGTMIGRELANGWFYTLVPQKVELFDGNSYEGIGLAPDVYFKNQLSQVEAGVDETLLLALQLIQEKDSLFQKVIR